MILSAEADLALNEFNTFLMNNFVVQIEWAKMELEFYGRVLVMTQQLLNELTQALTEAGYRSYVRARLEELC